MILPCLKFASSQPVSSASNLEDKKGGMLKIMEFAKTPVFE